MYYPATKIYIKSIEGKGLSVFASDLIEEGELIETCPLFSLGNNPGNKTQDPFFNYRFSYPREGAHNGNHDFVVAWGYGSLYNHNHNPNATWIDHPTEKAFQFIALRDIQPHDEICINYGGAGYWNDGRKDIKLL